MEVQHWAFLPLAHFGVFRSVCIHAAAHARQSRLASLPPGFYWFQRNKSQHSGRETTDTCRNETNHAMDRLISWIDKSKRNSRIEKGVPDGGFSSAQPAGMTDGDRIDKEAQDAATWSRRQSKASLLSSPLLDE
jgi:hypothetical protein